MKKEHDDLVIKNEDAHQVEPQAIFIPPQLIDVEIISVNFSALQKETSLIQVRYSQVKY